VGGLPQNPTKEKQWGYLVNRFGGWESNRTVSPFGARSAKVPELGGEGEGVRGVPPPLSRVRNRVNLIAQLIQRKSAATLRRKNPWADRKGGC